MPLSVIVKEKVVEKGKIVRKDVEKTLRSDIAKDLIAKGQAKPTKESEAFLKAERAEVAKRQKVATIKKQTAHAAKAEKD